MIRILLVADAILLRTALGAALSHHHDLDVVAEATSTEVTPELLGSWDPELVVVDLDTLSPSVTGALDTITGHEPGGAVLALTTGAASGALRHALCRKVQAFLSKDCRVQDLVDAVRRVAAGERFIEPCLAAAVVRRHASPLTARERDVLRLAAEGMSVREISSALFLTAGTVRTYLSTIIHKTGARSRVEAIRTATESDWL
ncbi:response regulator transcription factor [Couchioplanes caeruleus]|uniref:LuxR C-terminal-related transcriptional regulator n=1 Tax=Couchioplanes caeruleus TaxID=56438 RepID=UPI0020C015C1|nr:response regulator transcription factor [Couchioplanes caeruleus]UQU66519.1 response regulator transcription factor [Couchioplanes caeruleus]